ncbi:MAG TPA: hypothetical protein VF846_17340 [Thermoanaerobaculia bacterium]|jgi:tetratricopeptide (TPR) repeat protein
MIERHYDEEALISLLDSRREASDSHLLSCPPCAEKLESFRDLALALHDSDVWESQSQEQLRVDAVPSTVATLRAFADRMADEGTRAETYLTELLAGSRETWMARLAEHPEWRTAGTVRSLIDAASRAIDTMPPDAVEMTALATEIAEHLDQTAFPSDTVSRLRGAAWRERAYALYYTGKFKDAESAIFVSERHFCSCAVSEYEIARLGIVKALVLRAFERFDEAMAAASQSTETFVAFGDEAKTASAKLAQVHLLFSKQEFSAADVLLRQLDRELTDTDAIDTHARVLGNLGYSSRRLGKVEDAIRYYDLSAELLSSIGVSTEVVRVRWNVAATLAEAGRLGDAYDRMRALMPEMERLGMASEAASNALDLADVLLAENKYDEVEQLCAGAMKVFEVAGVPYTARALTALAYIRDAARQRSASRKLVHDVRDYIRRLPAQPTLLFAPPPP